MPIKIKMLIIGGCFPVQDNISPDKLYHRIIKDQLLEQNDIDLEIRILRYEKIKKCFNQIFEAVSFEKPDLILFHLRVEPILLPAKLFCKYHDKKGNLIKKINMSEFGLSHTIKHIQKREPRIKHNLVEKPGFQIIINKMLRELNYIAGYFLGNWSYIFKDYLNLTTKIIRLSERENTKLIITGPVSRPLSYFENRLSEKLDKYINKNMDQYRQTYLNLLGLYNEEGNFLFCNDLKRVNEIGHKRISRIIYNAIVKLKMNFSFGITEEVMI